MTLLTIDTKENCYVINSSDMENLQQNIANSLTLEKGTFDIQITGGRYSYSANSEGEPFVLLWIYGIDGNTFINKSTGYETAATWTTLNGYDDKLQIEVKDKAVICALFFDVSKADNKGEITLSVSSNKAYFQTQTLTINSKKNCYELNAKTLEILKKSNANSVELAPGNYSVKIRESNANYWSEKQKFKLEPWALLWIKGGKFISKLTKTEVNQSWCSLNGLKENIVLEVKEKTTLSGFFFDTYKEDNEGQIILEIAPISTAQVAEEYGKQTIKTSFENIKIGVGGTGTTTTTTTVTTSDISSGFGDASVGAGTGFGFSFSFDQAQMDQMWQQMAAQINSSITLTGEQDEKKEAYWENLEKWLLKGYQNQAKDLAMKVARMEFMIKTLTQQIEIGFNQNFQNWSGYFNKNLNDLFVSRIPRIVSEQVSLHIAEQTEQIKKLVIQQMQDELNDRVESVVNVKVTNQTPEIKNLVIQQLQIELEDRINNVVNVKIANQAKEINTQVVNQIAVDIDRRINDTVNVKIGDQSKDITNQVIQQIQGTIDQRVDNVVSIKIQDHTQNVKNLVIQQMQNYIDQRIDNVVSLKIANVSQDITTHVIHEIQNDISERINAVISLKLADQTPIIKNLVVQQIEGDIDARIHTVVNQSKDSNVQFVINNVMGDIDKRINVNFDNKVINFRNDISSIVKNELNQNFIQSVKNTIFADLKQQQFYVDMHSIKVEVENFYSRVAQFENQLYQRIEQGDTQLYNWTLEQLITLQSCLTDRQALVEMFESFATKLKDELDNTDCVNPSRFTAWVRRTDIAGQPEPRQLPQR